MTRKALVLGITGGFGEAVARSMVQNGWSVRAVMRDPSKLAADLHMVEVIPGDAGDMACLESAITGCDSLVYGVNVPYQHWPKQAMPLLETSCKVAEQAGCRILFPGNVYLYDPRDKKRVAEDAVQNPPTAKGIIRQQMEKRLQQAARQGAKILILRAGDFFGTGSKSSWMQEMIKTGPGKILLTQPAATDHLHCYAYLPDMADTAVQLLEKADKFADFECFHFRGHELTMDDLANSLARNSRGLKVKRRNLPWPILSLIGLFVPMFREIVKMRYLWQQELFLDNGKLLTTLDEEPHTPLDQALEGYLPEAKAQKGEPVTA